MRQKNRGIDHLVVCVRSLDAAISRWRELGFTTTPVAQHPWGTTNSLIQFDGNFVELLAIGDADAIVEPTPERFSFGRWNQQWLERGEGMSMLVFEGQDSRADVSEFRAAGLKTYEPFDFERAAKLPDGSSATVGFSLAFALNDAMPRSAFFTCHQHAPEYFWKAEYQNHANGGSQIIEVVMVDDEPVRHVAFFEALQGAGTVLTEGDQLRVETARGMVTVITPQSWQQRYAGVALDCSDGAVFGAMCVRTPDASRLPGSVTADANGRYWVDSGGLVVEFTPTN